MTPNVCRSSAELRPNSHMLPSRTEPNIRPNSSAELRRLPNFGPSLLLTTGHSTDRNWPQSWWRCADDGRPVKCTDSDEWTDRCVCLWDWIAFTHSPSKCPPGRFTNNDHSLWRPAQFWTEPHNLRSSTKIVQSLEILFRENRRSSKTLLGDR